jgi:hypothetical protein
VTITDDDLSRWEALCAAATPGLEYHHDIGWLSGQDPDGEIYTVASLSLDTTTSGRCYNAKANGAFLSAARTAVPDLCAEVRRLRDLDHSTLLGDALLDLQTVCSERDAARVEVSELRASLADAVGKIEVMRSDVDHWHGIAERLLPLVTRSHEFVALAAPPDQVQRDHTELFHRICDWESGRAEWPSAKEDEAGQLLRDIDEALASKSVKP